MILRFPVVGLWKPGEIHVTEVESSRPSVPEVEAIIEQTWQRTMARPDVHLFDGPMCRMEAVDPRPGDMRLSFSRTSYRIFLGTNLTNATIADRFGHDVLANSVGASAALISSDDQLLLGRRNASVAYYPSRVHPFAGCLEPAVALDVFDEVRRELNEELAFIPEDVAEMVCTGIAEDTSLRQPEMIFAVRSTRTFDEIRSRLDPAEHHGIFAIPATPAAIESAIGGAEPFTPVGVAAMLLYGRMIFGDTWFDAARAPFTA